MKGTGSPWMRTVRLKRMRYMLDTSQGVGTGRTNLMGSTCVVHLYMCLCGYWGYMYAEECLYGF